MADVRRDPILLFLMNWIVWTFVGAMVAEFAQAKVLSTILWFACFGVAFLVFGIDYALKRRKKISAKERGRF